jgi:hypothetical protein
MLPFELLRRWRPSLGRTLADHQVGIQDYAWLAVAGVAYCVWVSAHITSARYAMSWILFLMVPAAIVWIYLWRICGNSALSRRVVQGVTLAILLIGPVTSSGYWLGSNPISLLAGQVSLHQWEEQHLETHTKGYDYPPTGPRIWISHLPGTKP